MVKPSQFSNLEKEEQRKAKLKAKRKLNEIRYNLAVQFTNTTILHWSAGKELTDIKRQPTAREKQLNKI